jgi:hypothetical protein
MGQTAYTGYEVVLEDGFVDETFNGDPFNTAELQVEAGTSDEVVSFIRFNIPEPSAFTTAIPDNAILREVELRVYRETATGSSFTITAVNCIVNWVEAYATWDNSDGGSASWHPDAVPAAGETRSYDRKLGSVVTALVNTAYTLDLSKGVTLGDYKFGGEVNVLIYGASSTLFIMHSLLEVTSGSSAYIPKFRVLYEIPTPVGPTITVTPQDNGIDGYINITKHSENHTGYQAVYNDDSTTVTFSGATTDTIAIPDTGQDRFDTTTFDPDALDQEDENVAFVVYAEDSINTGNNGGKGNVVVVARPDVLTGIGYTGHTDTSDPAGSSGVALSGSAGDDTQAEIGEEVALAVIAKTSGVASGGSQGFFKYVYVNWDSGASDTNADYTKYTLDEPATTTAGNIAMTHRYSTSGGKHIKVQLEDVNGWRSNKTLITGNQPALDVASPVAALTTSRTKVLEATYGERGAALVLSGQQSHPVGSNRKIANYLFSYEADTPTTIVTSGAYNNDNSVFDSGSKRVAMISMGVDAMNTAQFKVFGLASFQSDDSTPVTDTDTTDFSHYRQAVDTITIDGTRYAGGAETIFTESQATTPNYFKTVDCVMCVVSDDDDDGDRYALRVFSTDEVVTANSVFRSPINTELRWKANPTSTNKSLKYAWGGFSQIAAGNFDFVTKSLTITDLDVALPVATVTTDGDHLLEVGDYIYINASNDAYDEYVTVECIISGGVFTYNTDNANVTNLTGTATAHVIELDAFSTGADDRVPAIKDWAAAGFYVGDIIKMGGSQSATFTTPKYYKIAGLSNTLGSGDPYFDRATIEFDTTKLTTEEQGYLTTAISQEVNETDTVIVRHNPSPTLTAAIYNTAGLDDTVTFIHGVIDDDTTSFVLNFDDTTARVRMAQPSTLNLDSLVSSGDITVESAQLGRSGGMNAIMSLGESRYPTNAIRTAMGLPTITTKIHVLTQAGLRDIFSLVEGDRFDYVFLDSRKVDSPTQTYRQYRMKLQTGSLMQDGTTANRYVAACTFVVVGEDAT